MIDEMPAWFWVPSSALLWATWIALKIADARERLARLDAEARRLAHQPIEGEQR